MGAFCLKGDDEYEANDTDQIPASRVRRLIKPVRTIQSHHPKSEGKRDFGYDKMSTRRGSDGDPDQWEVVSALDEIIDRKVGASSVLTATDPADYETKREELKRRESALGFEHRCASAASPKERRVNQILQDLKRDDAENLYANEPSRMGWGGQLHPRFAGDHFLSNKALIDRSKVFRVAQKMPKGAHLHIHFNACLLPNVLLEIASEMDHMYITSDLPLLAKDDYHNYKRAKIQFSIMAQPASTGNLFDEAYGGRRGAMKFKEFIAEFPRRYHPRQAASQHKRDALAWLRGKLVFREEEAHGALQTVGGAWEEFNTRTQMMKGLFNYETAYRTYTRKCLEDFTADNIQYAEIRPNFMDTNQVWTDDGARKIDNAGIMEMIIEEYERFQEEEEEEEEEETEGGGRRRFGGLKVIYCCPRSWPNEKVAGGLRECLAFKLRWPQWIAGFDLVGEEGKGKPLRAFVPEFLQFQQDCRDARPSGGDDNGDDNGDKGGVEIPFLFHCGETLDSGAGTADDNLVDALLLGARRLGHGFALARRPYLLERVKRAGVCLEVCPVSNEVLGLTPRAGGHAVYALLANNVHCTVNSDNGTLFNSTLSHDFYQVLVGKADMTLFGWKQLVEWSLQHACLSGPEYEAIRADWERRWEEFLDETIAKFGGVTG